MLQKLFGFGQATNSHIKPISPKELQQRLDADELLLVLDVRGADEFAHDGHIKQARLLPLPQLRQRFEELPKDRPIVCVCRSGARSNVACEQLAALGFENLYNMGGGMMAWQSARLPTV